MAAMQSTVTPMIEPDAEQMRQHLEHLFGGDLGGYHDGLIEIAWTHPVPNEKTGKHDLCHAKLFGTDEIDEAVEEAVRQNSRPNQNVYVGAALRKPTAAGRCYDDDFYAMPAFYADLDDAAATRDARFKFDGCPPTKIVVTGRHPEVRAQMWWRLTEPETDPLRAREQNGGLAKHFSGDASVRNVGRVMRLAGTIAWPLKAGRMLELTELTEPTSKGPAVYFAGQVARSFAPVPEQEAAATLDAASYTTAATDSLGLIDRITDGRERYMRNTIAACLIEIIGTTGAAPTADELFEYAWPQYARKVDFSRPGRGPQEFLEKCQHALRRFAAGQIRGARSLEDAIETYGQKKHVRAEPEALTNEGDARPEQPAQAGATTFDATPLGILNPKRIPARQWLLGRRLLRKFITLTVAPGGSGKSMLTMEEMVAVATGLPITRAEVHIKGPAWIYNNEDPLDELQRRIAAICIHHGIPLDGEVSTDLFLNSGRDRRLLVAKALNKAVVQMPDADALRDTILKRGIVAMTIDPFVRVHQVEENDNASIDAVADIFSRIADQTGCAFNLVHHTRKAPSGNADTQEGVADSARGAGALVAAARIAQTVLPMSKKDADSLGIPHDERRWYVRLDDAKGNMMAPADKVDWFKWESVPLGNGPLGMGGDEVGVLEPWDAPDVSGHVSMDLAMSVLKDVDLRWKSGNPFGQRGDRALTKHMAASYGMPMIQAKRLFSDWISNGVLASEMVDPKTKMAGLRVKQWPGDRS